MLVTGGMSCVCKSGKKHITDFKTLFYYLIVDVGWDWVNEKLYWTDPCANDIEVYDIPTAYRRVLYNSMDSVNDPSGIVIDPTTGYAKQTSMIVRPD